MTIAYATVGEGPPLVKASNWLSHLEAVVDAAGLDRFALLGVSQGGPIAIAYAVRHPEKVAHLVLHGAYSRGWLKHDLEPDQLAQQQLELDMVKVRWGRENPAFRQVFTTLFFPGASAEQMQWFNDLQRKSATARTTSPSRMSRHGSSSSKRCTSSSAWVTTELDFVFCDGLCGTAHHSPVTDHSDFLKNTLVDCCRIESEIGRGGMATVHVAHALKHVRKVAVRE